MIASRCGILCGECEFRLTPGCSGCTQIEKPFWGDSCTIKTCCEGKNLEHCGLCGEFPCAALQQFAYDPQRGDNGLRIRQCEAWAKQDEAVEAL